MLYSTILYNSLIPSSEQEIKMSTRLIQCTDLVPNTLRFQELNLRIKSIKIGRENLDTFISTNARYFVDVSDFL